MTSNDQKSTKAPTKIIVKRLVSEGDPLVAADFLVKYTSLSKGKIKELMVNGGVWLTPGIGPRKRKRVRRAQKELYVNDAIELYYDPSIIIPDTSNIRVLEENKEYGVYYKPAGVLSQGTNYGYEGSILRWLEKKHTKVFLIHRLDRETSGVIILAFNEKMAHRLSECFKSHNIEKKYQAIVLGKMERDSGEITIPIEGEKAITKYRVVKNDEYTTCVDIELITGKTHQIRIHFNKIGHPVIGDPLYGAGNKNSDGLRLVAYSLTLPHPVTKNEKLSFTLPKDLLIY